jgi:hypothetical protein
VVSKRSFLLSFFFNEYSYMQHCPFEDFILLPLPFFFLFCFLVYDVGSMENSEILVLYIIRNFNFSTISEKLMFIEQLIRDKYYVQVFYKNYFL